MTYKKEINPLLKELNKLPPLMTLPQFSESITDILLSTVGVNTHNISTELLPSSHTGFTIRSIRQMVYDNPSIKNRLTKEGKDLMLDHHSRVQILLAKRLSKARVGEDRRHETLSIDRTKDLEILLFLPLSIFKSGIQNITGGSLSEDPAPYNSSSKTQQILPHYRVLLGKSGLTLEWQEGQIPITTKKDTQDVVSSFIEIAFGINACPQLAKDITARIQEER